MRDKFPDLLRRELSLLGLEPDDFRKAIPAAAGLAGAAEDSLSIVLDLLGPALGPRGEGVFDAKERHVLRRLQSTLESTLSGEGPDSAMWTDAGVRRGSKWTEVRAAAREAMKGLGPSP